MSFDTGGSMGGSDEFPFPEKLALLKRGRTSIPAEDPWHYKELVEDRQVFGVQPPLWVVAFCDNMPSREPRDGEPERGFELEDGEVKPNGREPANDEYVVIKDAGGGQVTLVMAASRSGYTNGIEFDGETIIEDTGAVDPGYLVNLGLE